MEKNENDMELSRFIQEHQGCADDFHQMEAMLSLVWYRYYIAKAVNIFGLLLVVFGILVINIPSYWTIIPSEAGYGMIVLAGVIQLVLLVEDFRIRGDYKKLFIEYSNNVQNEICFFMEHPSYDGDWKKFYSEHRDFLENNLKPLRRKYPQVVKFIRGRNYFK